MAHPQAMPRGSPPSGPMGQRPPTTPVGAAPHPPAQEPPKQVELPPEKTFPCGCAWPGTHKPDCMWSLWEQMRDNYLKTRELMGKFMTQANEMQEAGRVEADKCKCDCPSGCHGTDLGAAMGLQQLTGVTVPWGTGPKGALAGRQQQQLPREYTVENETRKLLEEQKRIKNTWAQFFNMFDLALDLANDVSKDRWEQNRRRKERQRLEREQRLEELRKERLERQKGSKPEPPPEKGTDKTAADQKGGEKDKDEADPKKQENPATPAETTKDEKKSEKGAEETADTKTTDEDTEEKKQPEQQTEDMAPAEEAPAEDNPPVDGE